MVGIKAPSGSYHTPEALQRLFQAPCVHPGGQCRLWLLPLPPESYRQLPASWGRLEPGRGGLSLTHRLVKELIQQAMHDVREFHRVDGCPGKKDPGKWPQGVEGEGLPRGACFKFREGRAWPGHKEQAQGSHSPRIHMWFHSDRFWIITQFSLLFGLFVCFLRVHISCAEGFPNTPMRCPFQMERPLKEGVSPQPPPSLPRLPPAPRAEAPGSLTMGFLLEHFLFWGELKALENFLLVEVQCLKELGF